VIDLSHELTFRILWFARPKLAEPIGSRISLVGSVST